MRVRDVNTDGSIEYRQLKVAGRGRDILIHLTRGFPAN